MLRERSVWAAKSWRRAAPSARSLALGVRIMMHAVPARRRRDMNQTQVLLVLSLGLGLVVAGCEKKAEPPSGDPLKQAADAVGKAGDSAVVAILVAADEYDGKSDKTITKCAGCALGMDGKADNKIVYAEYTMWFCAPGCRDDFNKNVKESVLAMQVPKKK
jgi:hypothetical protein